MTERWARAWSERHTPWHREDVHPKLLQFADSLMPGVGATDEAVGKAVVFVPLCGKSLDMLWLRDKGTTVIGCELIEQGCVEFFTTNGIAFSKKVEKGISILTSEDNRIRLFCCNILDLTPELIGVKVDFVWDRGALVAMLPEERERYVRVIRSLLSNRFRYLLSTLQYEPDESEPPSPPFPVSLQETKRLFGDFCHVRVLLNQVESDEPITAFSFPITENLFLLSASSGGSDKEGKDADRIDYWQNRWIGGTAQWHSDKPHAFLVKYLHLLKRSEEKMRIFLPLCGKAGDLFWLYQQGHTVIGLEGVPCVVHSIFTDHNLDYVKTTIDEINGFVLKSLDDRLVIYCCDIFDMKPDLISPVEIVYDRGSFEAINVADRERYVDLMFKMLAPRFRIVLNGYEYDATKFAGPPMFVDREVVKKLYGSRANVKILEETPFPEKAKNFGLENMTKIIYFITNED